MKNILITTFAASMLAACGFMTPAKQYAGEVQGASGIAVIKGFTSYRPSTTLPLQGGKTYALNCEVREGQASIDVRISNTE